MIPDMKTKIYSILLLSAVICLTACDKFLTRTPYSQNSSSSMFASETLAESVVVGAYSNVLWDYVNTSALSMDAFASVLDPNYTGIDLSYGYLRGTIQPNNSMFSTYWKRLYEGVNRANDVIQNMGSVPGMSQELKERRIAECKFLRAFHYYRLNCLWRGVPKYDVNLAPGEYTRGRETEEGIWDFIIEDLTDCINCTNLPAKNPSGNSEYGRVTKGAAYALRGKVYLWKQEWALAEADFKAVKDCGYSLFQGSYKDLFKETYERCDEMIFSAQMVEQDGNGNCWSRAYGNYCTTGYAYCGIVVNANFVDSFTEKDGKPFNWDNYIPGYSSKDPKARSVYFLRDNMTDAEKASLAEYGADMTQYLSSGNEARLAPAYANRDPRLAAIAITPGSTYVGGASGAAVTYTYRFPYRDWAAPTYDLWNWTSSYFIYPIRKFVTEGRDYLNVLFNPVDIPIIRYADVLLCLAEAVNEQGRWDEAAGYVNQIRQRAGVALINEVGNQYMQAAGVSDMRERIINERRWELACEGQLYSEELRTGTWKETKFAEGNGLLQAWGDPVYKYIWGGDAFYKWAIPQTECEMNTNIKQNMYWD